jgi:hypothetical protein
LPEEKIISLLKTHFSRNFALGRFNCLHPNIIPDIAHGPNGVLHPELQVVFLSQAIETLGSGGVSLHLWMGKRSRVIARRRMSSRLEIDGI